MKRVQVILLFLMMMISLPRGMANPPPIITEGKGAATACVACHGLNGGGNAESGVPVLATMPEPYLIKQIADFKTGARSHHAMTAIAKAMTSEDIQAAAAYYADLPLPEGAIRDVDPAMLARGKELAFNGDWQSDVPPCFKCHAMGGGGVAPIFPPIAGQHASYIVNQLSAWKSGSRSNDPQKLMRFAVEKMSKEDMQSVAHYLSALDGRALEEGDAHISTRSGNTSDLPETKRFTPPHESTIPDNEFGKMVLMGKRLFINTQKHASRFVGNGLDCGNCHLDSGRKPDSAPLWAAYVLYPAYRNKTGQVDTLQSRIQGCFVYSMNGIAPPADSREMTALTTYMFWLAGGAPTGVKLTGQGYPSLPEPPKAPDKNRGAALFKKHCALCHGEEGQGTRQNDTYVFPPLWGEHSYNWGAGMHRINTAAGFIKANMPYGRGGSLTDQEAWDVALYINSHDRPQDPRFEKSVAHTRDEHHDEYCLYGRSPEQLAEHRTAKKKAEPSDDKSDAGDTRGLSPATAHALPQK